MAPADQPDLMLLLSLHAGREENLVVRGDVTLVNLTLMDYWYLDCGQVKAVTISQTSVTQPLTLLGFDTCCVFEGLASCGGINPQTVLLSCS